MIPALPTPRYWTPAKDAGDPWAPASVAVAIRQALPPHVVVSLAATTNERQLVDRAMLARFMVLELSPWKRLTMNESKAFAKSNGHEDGSRADSYAQAVRHALAGRVRKVIEGPQRQAKGRGAA